VPARSCAMMEYTTGEDAIFRIELVNVVRQRCMARPRQRRGERRRVLSYFQLTYSLRIRSPKGISRQHWQQQLRDEWRRLLLPPPMSVRTPTRPPFTFPDSMRILLGAVSGQYITAADVRRDTNASAICELLQPRRQEESR